MTDLSQKLGRQANLDDVPDEELDQWKSAGFDWIWLLSVWNTGAAAQKVSRTHLQWLKEFNETLPDLKDEDIGGSGFAITGYQVHPALGGDEALVRLRQRMKDRGMKLMLDFVPNHMGLGHPWMTEHPDYFIQGNENDAVQFPENYFRSGPESKGKIFAHGRDPYFPGWPDTIQLNYGNPDLLAAMIDELIKISGQCDGVRCDMAMLVLPDIFERTWGIRMTPFWPEVTKRLKRKHPAFTFMAEVYWDLEWNLQQQGFDYTYDKRLYDRLREGKATPVREHFMAGLDFQNKLVRFLENHDEPRTSATFELLPLKAAAVITFLSPGLRFFHLGQLEGRKKRISPHIVRAPEEHVDAYIHHFYEHLLGFLHRDAFRLGSWQLLNCLPAWEGNASNENYIAFYWSYGSERYIVAVNYSEHHSQCYIRLPLEDLSNHMFRLEDQFGQANLDRDGNDLSREGLYLDEPAWKYYVFSVIRQ